MTRIDFRTNVSDKIVYACRLALKARAADCKLTLLVSDHVHLAALNQALWTFSDLDFLPHVMADDPLAAQTPVILTDNDTAELPHHQILINLSGRTPAHFARFERMFEIISRDEADETAGRERYRFYRQCGYPLTHLVTEKT